MEIELKKFRLQKVSEAVHMIEHKSLTEDYHARPGTMEEIQRYYKKCEIYLAKVGGRVAGFAAMEKQKDSYELLGLCVIPEFQGKGIGRKFMDVFVSKGKGKPHKLVTHPGNSRALVLYLKYGFRIREWKDNYYGDGQPRLVLKKERKGTPGI